MEKFYKSKHARLRIIYEGDITTVTNGIPIKTPAKDVQFEDGLFRTNDPEKQKAIESHPFFKNGQIMNYDPEEAQRVTEKQTELNKIDELLKQGGYSRKDMIKKLKKGEDSTDSEPPKNEEGVKEKEEDKKETLVNTTKEKDSAIFKEYDDEAF